MHALRRFIQSELDARGWQARDLVNASGLSKQLVSQLLNDDRDVMPQMPKTTTLEALAKAFNVATAHVTTVAVEALGIPGVQAPVVRHEVREADDAVLLRELLRRATERSTRDQASEASVSRLPIRVRPASTIEADLAVAEADLADWEQQELTGEDAESHRQMLRSRVDAFRSELVASRSVLGDRDSVAKL